MIVMWDMSGMEGEMADEEPAAYVKPATELHAMERSHELLHYLFDARRDKVFEEFLKRFGLPNATREDKGSPGGLAYAFQKYAEALAEACLDLEKDINVTPERPLDGRYLIQ